MENSTAFTSRFGLCDVQRQTALDGCDDCTQFDFDSVDSAARLSQEAARA